VFSGLSSLVIDDVTDLDGVIVVSGDMIMIPGTPYLHLRPATG
jgi:hypothetical protein